MKTIIRKKKSVQLKDIGEWMQFAYDKYGSSSGMVGIEQAYFQSKQYKICARCLSEVNLILQTGRELIKSTDYYLCENCLKELG